MRSPETRSRPRGGRRAPRPRSARLDAASLSGDSARLPWRAPSAGESLGSRRALPPPLDPVLSPARARRADFVSPSWEHPDTSLRPPRLLATHKRARGGASAQGRAACWRATSGVAVACRGA